MISKKTVPKKKSAVKKKTAAKKNITAKKKTTSAKKKPLSGGSLMSVVTLVLWAAVAGCLAGALVGWIVAQSLHVPQVDLLATFEPAATTRIYAADGAQVASYALEQRVVLRPEEIPDDFKLAVVAIEDADFYTHGGVDPKAILRAVWYSVLDRRIGSRGGASTLTQQLAKNLWLSPERSLKRKIEEAVLTWKLERSLSKKRILELYLNCVEFGPGIFGAEAAALYYYHKPASELKPEEAAHLAAALPRPSQRHPGTRSRATEQAVERILWRMKRAGWLKNLL